MVFFLLMATFSVPERLWSLYESGFTNNVMNGLNNYFHEEEKEARVIINYTLILLYNFLRLISYSLLFFFNW